MKKVIIILAIGFIATKSKAQLSSERPAMTPAQVTTIMNAQKETADKAQAKAAASTEANAPKSATTPAVVVTPVSNQGGVKPSEKPAVPVETKLPAVSTQGVKVEPAKKEQH